MDNDNVLYRVSSCAIVKFLYYLANLRDYYNGRCWSQRYKSGTNNRAKMFFIDFT